MMYQRDMSETFGIYAVGGGVGPVARPSRNRTTDEKTASVPKKKKASMLVMMTTMMAVETVSLRVGQWTRVIASRRTCLTNSPGETFATLLCSLADRKVPREAKWPAGLEAT